MALIGVNATVLVRITEVRPFPDISLQIIPYRSGNLVE